MSLNTNESVTIRLSRPDDAAKIARLAQLDSARPPRGPLLLAEVAGGLRAALPVDGGAALADPFRHTLDLVSLLEVRRQHVIRVGVVRTRSRASRSHGPARLRLSLSRSCLIRLRLWPSMLRQTGAR